MSVLDVRNAEQVRTEAFDCVQSLLQGYDIIATPTLGMSPFEKDTQPTMINGTEIDPLHGWILTWPFNLSGNPTASVPVGFSEDGLPVGMQMVGRRHEDDAVLKTSAAFEEARSWAPKRPLF